MAPDLEPLLPRAGHRPVTGGRGAGPFLNCGASVIGGGAGVDGAGANPTRSAPSTPLPRLVIPTVHGPAINPDRMWVKHDQAILSAIQGSLGDGVAGLCLFAATSMDAWTTLEHAFAQVSTSRSMAFRSELVDIKKLDSSTTTYFNKMKRSFLGIGNNGKGNERQFAMADFGPPAAAPAAHIAVAPERVAQKLLQGLGMLALSSMFSSPSEQCKLTADGRQACPRSSLQTAFFYVSLYLVAIAQSGHKPCVQAFGADQFDATDPAESLARGSFFNWWYFGICGSATVTIALMSYVQDNVSWGIGFGVPCVVMVLALAVFLLGTKTYRFYDNSGDGKGAGVFSRVVEAFRASRKRSPEGGEHGHGDGVENAAIVEEAATMDRRVGSSGFQIPPAALQCFMGISMITCVALLWWIMPQYVLLGAADVFTMVGMQEFFYDQMPGALKSLGLALYLSVLGVGSFISSFLISAIDGATRRGGGTSWIADNLNRGHLDYFYVLIAALTALELLAFLYFSVRTSQSENMGA
uniref:Peptide transporter PTR2 n=1 Tax=Aegilops tauschii TaxID=37682 RepID=M8CDJ5_AEGTA